MPFSRLAESALFCANFAVAPAGLICLACAILLAVSGSRPCELGAKQTILNDEPGGRLQSRLRGSLEAIEIETKEKM